MDITWPIRWNALTEGVEAIEPYLPKLASQAQKSALAEIREWYADNLGSHEPGEALGLCEGSLERTFL